MPLRFRIALVALSVVVCPGILARQSSDDYSSKATEFCTARQPGSARRDELKPSVRRSDRSSRKKTERKAEPASSTDAGALQVGATLYVRSAAGVAVRANPDRSWSDGEAIRVVVESTIGGFLYIFDEDQKSGEIVMIYPQIRLSNGENRILAHVPYEVPSRHEADPANQWMILQDGPTTDRLWIVVSATKLPVVPTGADLKSYCAGKRDCYWVPSPSDWRQVALSATRATPLVVSREYGQQITRAEDDAIGRSVRLGPEAPPPSAIAVGGSGQNSLLIACLDVRHTGRSQ